MVYLTHIANVLYLFSYLVRDILWLRVLTVVASMVLLAYFFFLPAPLWAAIAWNVLFLGINARQIRLLLLERRPIQLSPDELLLHELAFRRLTPREFTKLLAAGRWGGVGAGECIVKRGEPLHDLTVLVSGRVRVEVDGKTAAELRPGCFVGEMSFISGSQPNADVVTMEPTRTVSWRDEALNSLLSANPELRAAVQQVIGEDLVAKLRPA
jgi:CRP-like cAMP-binding protein